MGKFESSLQADFCPDWRCATASIQAQACALLRHALTRSMRMIAHLYTFAFPATEQCCCLFLPYTWPFLLLSWQCVSKLHCCSALCYSSTAMTATF